MNRLFLIVFLFSLFGAGLVWSCTQAEDSSEPTLSELMRERTNQIRDIKSAIEAGQQPDASLFVYDAFTNGEPSRDALKEPGVQGQLMAFDSFYARFAENPTPANYDIMIKTCISCHERLCPGPLRLIRSLSIEEIEEPSFQLF